MIKILILTLLFLSSVKLSYGEYLTLEDIVSIPDVSDVSLSPDGNHIAYLVKVDTDKYQGILIKVYDTKIKQSKQLLFTEYNKYIISSILWGNNNTLIIKAKFPSKRNRVEVIETRLLKVDINTGEQSEVLTRKLFNKMTHIPNIMSDIIDILPEDKNHILVSLGGFSLNIGNAVMRIPITDKGEIEKVQREKRNITRWITDAKHNVRIGIYNKKTTYVIREKLEDKSFKDLWAFEVFSKDSIWPLGFGADNYTLYVMALYQGKDAVYKVDLRDPELKKELVLNHKNYDVEGELRRSKETNEVVGIGYYYWDEKYKNLMESIDLSLPDTDNIILEISDDGNKYILFTSNDNEPGNYYIGDKQDHTIKFIAHRYKKLTPKLLSQKTKIKYKARDGLEIEGFITLPQGKKTKNLPTIIFPHGGPISYDSSGFDYWTQFFSNKGYAVFQMNFRGSSGYGHDFMKQGIASWGQAMQDDVEDGTQWLINEGIADKDKVCIIGASYGGYAALMGGIKSPDLYQCIVSFAGVTNVGKLVRSYRRFTNYDIVKKQIGNDYDKLLDSSPVKHSKKINKPVLLIHGTKDRVVDPDQSEDMFDELKENNKVVEYIELEDGDHYLSNNEHRLQTFKAIDKFLDNYLPIN